MTRLAERFARVLGVLALAMALLLAVVRAVRSSAERVGGAPHAFRIDSHNGDSATGVARMLGAFTVDDAVAQREGSWPALFVVMSVIPSPGVRGVLGGARRAGMPMRWWDSTGVRALALAANGTPMPQPSTLIAASATARDSVAPLSLVVRDAGGVLDSVAGSAPLIGVRATQVSGVVRAQVQRRGTTMATATVLASSKLAVRRVLFMGQPGWDAKFVIAALEESGWLVDGTLALSLTARARVGAPSDLDTARYSAVVVIDSGVANERVLRRFVSQGGGAVIAGDALRDPELASLVPARIVGDRAVVAGSLLTDQPLRGLPAYRLRAERAAIVLAHEGTLAMVVASRRSVGRLVASGYRATWHWRMEGRDGSMDAHRQWWNALVSAVAFAPVTTQVPSGDSAPGARWPGDAAPVADLVARVGEPSGELARPGEPRRAVVPLWLLFAIAVVALLLEWLLRRLRGAP